MKQKTCYVINADRKILEMWQSVAGIVHKVVYVKSACNHYICMEDIKIPFQSKI